MAKNIFKILAVFVIGAVGGIFAEHILWPYFIERPLFYEYRLEQGPVYITEKKETTMHVQENEALREAVEKMEKVVVGVKTETLEGEILQGSGLVLTSDGLIVTLASLVPFGSKFAFFVDEKWPSYQVLKRDMEDDLALIKIEGSGLKTCGFTELDKMRLGERVFLINMDFIATTTDKLLAPRKMVNEGIISFFDVDSIQTNIFETENISGSPLFDIEGKAIGLNFVDETGRVSTIPMSKIRTFVGL